MCFFQFDPVLLCNFPVSCVLDCQYIIFFKIISITVQEGMHKFTNASTQGIPSKLKKNEDILEDALSLKLFCFQKLGRCFCSNNPTPVDVLPFFYQKEKESRGRKSWHLALVCFRKFVLPWT